MTQTIRRGCAILGVFLLLWGAALCEFYWDATSDRLYANLRVSLDIDAGIDVVTAREYETMLSEYLRGDESALRGADLFTERERTHMKDVYDLFALVRNLWWIFFALGAVILFAVLIKNPDWADTLDCGRRGTLLFFVPILALALWAAIDFNGAFTAMHHVLFTNDLWQLSSTDLLIRMFPEQFFAELAKQVGGHCFSGVVLLIGALSIIVSFGRKKEKV